MHATNENIAEVMGWTLNSGCWVDGDNKIQHAYSHWRPIADLNHAALVEARLRELGLLQQYGQAIAKLLKDEHGRSSALYFLTATAQTRCDAAWAAYQAWKEQGK